MNTMKTIEVVYKRYNISLINVTDFTVTLRAFIKNFYDFLMFKKVTKMYKNYKEILKQILVTAGTEPIIIQLPA